ncbi:4163_t:CDS:2 [Gigaspora margarita]|uniref:4163_t:CDS:1 n=1 Tax=Gigaspora margarita TaxID=4874 RepID=A0ABN7VNP7_GIGMA|nr:4163_t:CDS:2 [Gigaspora margarita]
MPTNRSDNSCANFDNGLIAIFSGVFSGVITNDLWIFNTLTLTWSLSHATNAPLPMYAYCAVTLPDGNILYIGGYSHINSILVYTSMNNLPLYNTTSNTWENMSILGPLPPFRADFPAVLSMVFNKSLNVLSIKRIIIFGGRSFGTTFGDLWIVNTTKFWWSYGNISNPIVDLTLAGHTATLVDNYMFVSFGKSFNYPYAI